jgi:hypothetical protein
MHRITFGAALASLALTTGTVAVLAAAPAQADTATRTALDLGGHTGLAALYGSDIGTLFAQVSDGTNPATAGSADLQQRLPGKGWKTVRTDRNVSDGISFGSYGSKARGNVKYRVHYLGGTDSGTATTYRPSYSNTVVVRTAWNLNAQALCTTHCRFYGKLTPKAKHRKIVIQVNHHGWKHYKTLHTNAHSRWSAVVKPARGKGAYYRAVVAKTKNLIKSYAIGHFTITGKSSYGVTRR